MYITLRRSGEDSIITESFIILKSCVIYYWSMSMCRCSVTCFKSNQTYTRNQHLITNIDQNYNPNEKSMLNKMFNSNVPDLVSLHTFSNIYFRQYKFVINHLRFIL